MTRITNARIRRYNEQGFRSVSLSLCSVHSTMEIGATVTPVTVSATASVTLSKQGVRQQQPAPSRSRRQPQLPHNQRGPEDERESEQLG
jgi:hypothetical protein